MRCLSLFKKPTKRHIALILIAAVAVQSASCGTLIHFRSAGTTGIRRCSTLRLSCSTAWAC